MRLMAEGRAMAKGSLLCVSHKSALFYWRGNPPWHVLEGSDQNIRSLRGTPTDVKSFADFALSEREFGSRPIDVLVPNNDFRAPRDYAKHVQTAKLPARALYPVGSGVHVVSPELCLVQMCQSLDFLEAVELGMELCGTYAMRINEDGRTYAASRSYKLISADDLVRHLASWKNLRGLSLARKVAPFLVDGAASPMETKAYLLLCLPQRYGGYHLPKPELNAELAIPPELQLVLGYQKKVKPDLLWREGKVVLEYDGGYHDDAAQRTKDEMRRVVLESMGYTVMEIKRQQLYSATAFDAVATRIAQCLGKRIRPLSMGQAFARDDLRRRLLTAGESR